MNDWAELKRLAEAALRNWPDSKIFERPECDRFIDAARPDVVLGLIERATAGGQHHLDSEELRSLCRQRDQLKAEVEALRGALAAVLVEVDGNIRPTVRDCVNGRDDVQDIYEYCDAIEGLIDAAMSKGEVDG